MSQNRESQYETLDERSDSMDSGQDTDRQVREPTKQQARHLRRSKRDRVVAGVCGGLGNHVDIDPFLFRIAFLLSLLAGGAGLIAYVVFWIAVPEAGSPEEEAVSPADRPVDRGRAGLIAGGTLVILGVMILMREFLPWFDSRVLGAFVLIGIGAIVLIRGVRRD